MAAVFSVNETPATTSCFFALWRMYQQMKLAGWTVWGSSNGTSFSTAGTDHWSPNFGAISTNPGAWIAFTQPGIGANLRGICFDVDVLSPSVLYRVIYTTTGWSSSGVNATTSPLAVGTTGYALGSSGAGHADLFCDTPHAVNKLNIICRDAATDGGVTLFGFESGLCTTFFCFSKIIPWTGGPMDGYLIAAGDYSQASQPATWAGIFKAVDAAGVMQNCVGALVRDEGAGAYGSGGVWLDAAGQRDAFVSTSSYVLQNPIYRITGTQGEPLGQCKELVIRPGNSNYDFYGNNGSAGYDWVRSACVQSGAAFPWDGVTTSISTS